MQLLWKVKCIRDDENLKKLLNNLNANSFEKACELVEKFTKRNYSEQEINDLGAHIYEVHEMYKFHKWFKSKIAILIAAGTIVLALSTCAEKIHKAIEFFGLIPK
jgi:hypothetical protein